MMLLPPTELNSFAAASQKGGQKCGRGDVFIHGHMFFNLQQNLQQNEGEGYWRMVADSD